MARSQMRRRINRKTKRHHANAALRQRLKVDELRAPAARFAYLFTGGEGALLLEVERHDDHRRNEDQRQTEPGDDAERQT